MPRQTPPSKTFASVDDGVITFNETGAYTLQFLNTGVVKVTYGGPPLVVNKPVGFDAQSFNAAEVTLVTPHPVNLVNIDITPAGSTGGLEPTVNLDALIERTLGPDFSAWPAGIDDFVAAYDINGGDADVIKLLWDFLDDNYTDLNQYYSTPLNESFVRLGVEYVKYLNNGGEAFTDILAKFTADNGDDDSIPQRAQSLHDNLLSNLTDYSITQRNFPAALDAELKALVASVGPEYLDRIDASGSGAFSGDQTALGGVAHDQARAFDWDKGFDRSDWLDVTFNGTVDPQAHDPATPGYVYYGTGNPVDDFNVVRHEGAQVELALKVKHRGGDEYAETSTSIAQDGISASYSVKTGTDPANANRAEWSFDWSATDYGDEDIEFRMLVDSDPGASVAYVDQTLQALFSAAGDGGGEFQNSWNVSFGFLKPEGYTYGEGQFDVRLEALKDGQVIAYNHATIYVDPLLV